ncbi:MAG: hypothetical protein AAFN77_12870 [Planctomycetota bacterium]
MNRATLLHGLPWLVVTWLILGLPSESLNAQQAIVQESLPNSWKDDAELTDIQFLNERVGWAVGAQGTVLRTENGGSTWKEISHVERFQQDSVSLEDKIRNLQAGRRTKTSGLTIDGDRNQPLRCRFESIHFVDENHGWIAGGYSVPYLDRSRAVILKTDNGGKTWTSVEGLMIPRIRKIHFESRKRGWAVGDKGSLFSSGYFTTNDGGQSWSVNNQMSSEGWITGANTKQRRCVIDSSGRLGVVREGKLEVSVLIGLDDEPVFRDLLMLDDQNGVAVGERGTVVRTTNSGRSWQAFDLKSAAPVLSQLNLSSVVLGGSKLWFVGDPGSFLVSLDLTTGKTNIHATNVTTRLNRIHFFNEQVGFVVGEFGVILKTENGGESWAQQRGSTKSSALMVVTEDPTHLPLAMLAQYSAEENRICSTVVLQGRLNQFERSRQAVTRLGNATCKLLSLSSAHSTTQFAKRSLVLESLVQQIRISKPLVIICPNRESYGISNGLSDSWDSVELVREAIRLAAEEANYPEHQLAGLSSHQVHRLVLRDVVGPISIDPDQLLARNGRTVTESIALSRALIGKRITMTDRLRYQVHYFAGNHRFRNGDVLSDLGRGVLIPTRPQRKSLRANLTDIKQSTERNRKLETLLSFEVHQPEDIQVWRRQIEKEITPYHPNDAAIWLMRLTEGYQAAGKMELAAQTAQLLATRWADSPYSLSALAWLAEFYASEEWGLVELQKGVQQGRLQVDGRPSTASKISNQFATAPTKSVTGGVKQMKWEPLQTSSPVELQFGASHNATASLESDVESEFKLPSSRPAILDQRLRVAARFLSAASQRDPDLAASDWYQWSESQLTRRTGGTMSTMINQLKRLNGSMTSQQEPFRVAAKRELILLGNLNEAPKSDTRTQSNLKIELATLSNVIEMEPQCALAETSPKLDGILDDAFWKKDTPTMQNGQVKNQVRFARDDEFLYVAIRCRKIAGASYQWEKAARPRDADLDRRDRVAIWIDADRDYLNAFRFEIDHRGWVRDACNDDLNWNPNWYVAQSETEDAWTIEAAIPLNQLVSRQIDVAQPWCVRTQRLTGPQKVDSISPFQVRSIESKEYELLKFAK